MAYQFHQRRRRYIWLLTERNFNLRNLFHELDTEDQAIEAALSWLMIPDRNMRCTRPNCNSDVRRERHQNSKIGWAWRCRTRRCHKLFHPTANTFFEHSHLPVRKIILLMYF